MFFSSFLLPIFTQSSREGAFPGLCGKCAEKTSQIEPWWKPIFKKWYMYLGNLGPLVNCCVILPVYFYSISIADISEFVLVSCLGMPAKKRSVPRSLYFLGHFDGTCTLLFLSVKCMHLIWEGRCCVFMFRKRSALVGTMFLVGLLGLLCSVVEMWWPACLWYSNCLFLLS
jgi:hypothetical protein